MQKFFFDMKDGVPHRDIVGIEFKTQAEAIEYCKLPDTSETRASATIRTLRYPWSTR